MTRAAAFAGNIPRLYHENLSPILFGPYAKDLAARLQVGEKAHILEIAAGTGIFTEELLRALPPGSTVVATDLSEPMLDVARSRLGSRARWQVCDAQDLPFGDRTFDAVVCHFGVMFFEDKVRAFREACRVQKAGAQLLFNTWCSEKANPAIESADKTLERLFPKDPPDFLQVPYGYYDECRIREDLRDAGYETCTVDEVARSAGVFEAGKVAVGIVKSSPLATYIEDRKSDLDKVSEEVENGLVQQYGSREIPVMLCALVVSAFKS